MIDEASALSRAGIPSSSDRARAKIHNLGLELVIGSNIFRNTNGVVTIQGKEQLVIEFQPEQGLLLATMDLYNENGAHIAHLRRNVFMLNLSEQFAVETHRPQQDVRGDYPWVRLTDRRSGSPAIEIHMVSAHRIHILSGKFYSHRGMPVEITPNYCRIGSHVTLFGEIVENRGGMVVLGSELSQSLPIRP
jgi:hypothetical protein